MSTATHPAPHGATSTGDLVVNLDREFWQTMGHAVQRCDATTGHAVRDVAFCDNAERAKFLVAAIRDRADLIAALNAAAGYLLNAKIDLETGAPKKTAIATIEGGLRVVRAAIAKAEGQP